MKHPIRLTVNEEPHELLVEPFASLLDTLRDDLHLTGPRRVATRATAAPAPSSWTALPLPRAW